MSDAFAAVAPHVGAWIEIRSLYQCESPVLVAPHVGAWIEIIGRSSFTSFLIVAPHVGAWIEILTKERLSAKAESRTPRGCVD